ncbi:bacteriohemerythrin [Methylomarinum vadi]|uniref:bacteriohemerythrin n=1 Tax=Methylomarinum vadi TaxID=438855 RepID=UPI0004DF78B3|nr:hemerythrin domain-containing protein [Methylomarinum vadi]
MAILENNQAVKTGYEPIDTDHEEFIQLLSLLASADDDAFPDLFRQLQQHVEAHFERENQLMEQFAFPAIAEHRAEHARVLNEIKQFSQRVEKGLVAFGRAFVEESLPQWFELHAATMDRVLALHIKANS